MNKREAKAILEKVLSEMAQHSGNEFLKHDLSYGDGWEELLQKIYNEFFEVNE